MKKMLIGAFAVGMLALVACSSDDPASAAAAGDCPAVGTKQCSADDPISQASVDQCNKDKADAKCGSAYVEFLKCAGKNLSCGADNKTDSSKLASACPTETQNYTKCKLGQ